MVAKLNYRLLAALGLVIVHSIHIRQLVQVYQLPSLMHMRKQEGGVACVCKVRTMQYFNFYLSSKENLN